MLKYLPLPRKLYTPPPRILYLMHWADCRGSAIDSGKLPNISLIKVRKVNEAQLDPARMAPTALVSLATQLFTLIRTVLATLFDRSHGD